MLKFLGHKAFILKLVLLFSFSLLASEAKEESSQGSEKEKEKRADLPPWTELQNKISQLEAKMQQKRENIEKLVIEKQKVKSGSPRVKEIINTMISEHKELQGFAKEYEKTITIFRFRYPERGAKADRKYEPTEVKSLEEMEEQMGTDAKLTRNMKKLRTQYGEDDQAKKKAPVLTPAEEKKQEKSVEESGTIIIKK